jgi:hypothetical protein
MDYWDWTEGPRHTVAYRKKRIKLEQERRRRYKVQRWYGMQKRERSVQSQQTMRALERIYVERRDEAGLKRVEELRGEHRLRMQRKRLHLTKEEILKQPREER